MQLLRIIKVFFFFFVVADIIDFNKISIAITLSFTDSIHIQV